MKKIVFILVFGCSMLWSRTLVVDINPTNVGFTTMSCKGTTSPYSTIQSAIDDASAGDTVEICKGTYSENLNVDKDNLTIKGVVWQDIDDVVIDGGSDTAILVKSKNETFDNFKIISDKKGIDGNSNSGGSNTFKNLIINSGQEGIYLSQGNGQTFKNLTITAGAQGIYTYYHALGTKDFQDINISSGGDGVLIYAGAKVSCDTLDINSSGGKGIYIKSANGKHILNNITVNSSDDSIYVRKGGKSFTNLDLKSVNGVGLEVVQTDENLTFSNILIQSKKQGLVAGYYALGAKDLQDINISSDGDGVYIRRGKKISCDTIDINSSGGMGIYIEDSNGDHTFNNLAINSSKDSIHINKGGKSFSNLELNSTNGTGIKIDNTDANLTFSSIAIQSKNQGIHTDYYATGTKDFQDINISSGGDGIYIYKGAKVSVENLDINSSGGDGINISGAGGDHTFDNLTINSEKDSIRVGKGGKSFSNLELNSTNGIGIKIDDTDENLTFSSIAIHSKNQGIYTYYYATGTKDFQDINISSGGDGIYIRRGKKISCDTLDINSSGGKGIYIKSANGKHIFNNITVNSSDDSINTGEGFALINDANLTSSGGSGIVTSAKIDTNVTNVQINSKKTGISFGYGNYVNILVKCSTITSTDPENGIYVSKAEHFTINSVYIKKAKIGVNVDSSVKNAIIKNSKIENTTDYAIYLRSSYSGSTAINNNCFSGAKLAYTRRSGYNFDGNYWDGVSDSNGDGKITHSDAPVKISNYVVDNSPKDGCDVDQQCTDTSSPPIEEEINNYKFDAWDIFRNISDKNISTKIVGQDFNLTIASLDENGSALADFNGTVCIRALDDKNSSLNSWQKIYFNDEDKKNITINGINVARKKVRMKISWKNGVNESCPLSDEDNSTLSSDDFAIRPDRFIITAQAPFYAGDDFNITFQALDGSDANSSDYNETKGISFLVESNITKPGCYQGVINVDNFSFQNGIAKDINASYSNIGDINITIKEKLGSEFAIVDADDTNDSDRLIEENSTKITVIPYDINITNVLYQNSTGKSWLYDANVSDMNVTIETTVKAFAKGSATSLPDFNATCYAKDVNLSFLYDTNYSDSNVSLDTTSLKGNLSYQDINSSSILILSSQFVNGEANASYAFNVKRVYNKPLNPVKIKLKDINITTASISKNQNGALQTGNINSDQNSTFYYGRIYAQDLETTKKISSSNIFIDVYCNGCNNDINKFFQDSLNWYKNEFDTVITKKTDITILPKEGFLLSSPNKSNISISNITDANSSKISFDVTNSKDEYDTALFHLLIPRWLWYNAYKDYNASNGSNCSTHPCIGYRMLPSVNSSINSGTFKGSDIGHEQNRTIKKAGVKVYR